MIAGKGKAMEIITGIIESLGKAIGTVLHDVLVGFGKMIKLAGPSITLFFNGIATVIKALHPIIVAVFKVIKDIITDPVFNKTIRKVLETVQVLIVEIGKVIAKVGDVIIKVIENIGGIIESVGKAISNVFTSIGDAVSKVIGSIADLIKTIGDTIVTIIDGVVSGIERLANLSAGNMLAVAAGLTAMAAALMLFSVGAALAGAIMPSRETLEGIAKSVVMFGDIDSANLSAVGKGMTDIGIGLAVFGVGGKLADLLKVEEGGLEGVAKSVEMFGKVPSDNLAQVGIGMKEVGIGLLAFGAGGKLAALLNDPKGLEGVADSVTKFGVIDATNFAMVGDGIKKLGVGLLAFGGGGAIGKMASAFGDMFSSEKDDPVEKFKKFAVIGPGLKDASDGIEGLAKAFSAFDAVDPAKAGKAVNEFANSIDPAAISKLKESFAGLSSEALFKGGVYKLEPVLGKFETGGLVPTTGTYQLEKNEMVVDEAAVQMLVQGAQVISAMQTGEELTGLQKESNQLTEGVGAPIVVNAPTNTSINQAGGTSVMLPPSPISPNQSDIPSTLD